MNWLTILFIFFFGAILGSFLNVLIYRFNPEEEKFSFIKSAKGRSKCPHCNKVLLWFELIPILSFIIQKGRCNGCKKKISRRYIIIELLTGIVFVLIAYKFFSFPPFFLFWLFIAFFLILISAIDFYHYLIPDNLIKIIFGIGLFPAIATQLFHSFAAINYLGYYSYLFPRLNYELLNYLIGIFSFSSLLFIISIISNEKYMGMGDVKLMAVLGLILGWPAVILVFILSFLSGAFLGLALIFLKKKSLASALPFGPFLAFSALAVALWGEQILKIYFKIAGL